MSAVHPVMQNALKAAAPKADLADTRMQERGYHIDYRIEGTLEQVQRAIAGLFRDFHPQGYSTQVKDIQFMRDDKFVALVTRARSCE